MKKQLTLAAALMATTAMLQASTIIGDFEGASLDGWSAGGGATLSFDTVGATLGSSSLKIAGPTGWATVLNLDAMSYLSQLSLAESISLDITTRNDDGSVPSWWIQNQIILNSDTTGWVGLNGDNGTGVGWALQTTHETYAIPSSVAAQLASATWVSITLTENSSGATFYVDNIAINASPVPEPGTAALLGLAGLGGLIFRRRATR